MTDDSDTRRRPAEPPVVPTPPAPGTVPPDGVPWTGPERVRADPAFGLRWLGVVVAIMALGVVAVSLGHWEIGAGTVGAGMIVGAIIRALVPSSDVGLLRVRNRAFDASWMLLVGAGIIALVLSRM